jgi:hypothetical protein
VPLSDKRLVEVAPLALEPNGGRREPFLTQGIDSDHVIAPRRFAHRDIFVPRILQRLLGQSRHRIFVVAAIHAIYAVAGDPLFGIGRPLELATRAVFPAEEVLRRGGDGEHGRRRAAFCAGSVHRTNAIRERAPAVPCRRFPTPATLLPAYSPSVFDDVRNALMQKNLR